MTYIYAISAPSVAVDLILAQGATVGDGNLLNFKSLDGAFTGSLWLNLGHALFDKSGLSASATLAWEGEVPKPQSLNRDSTLTWVKQQIAEALVQNPAPLPTDGWKEAVFRVEDKLDALSDMYRMAYDAAAKQFAGAPPGPRQIGMVKELAMGYGAPSASAAEPDAELAKFLEGVVGVVEATGFEFVALREQETARGVRWKSVPDGMWRQIGDVLPGRTVCVGLNTAQVNGSKILFWEPTSDIVDYAMIYAWLKRVLPASAFLTDGQINRTDAANFHHIRQQPAKAEP